MSEIHKYSLENMNEKESLELIRMRYHIYQSLFEMVMKNSYILNEDRLRTLTINITRISNFIFHGRSPEAVIVTSINLQNNKE